MADTLSRLWAKTNKESAIHLLIYHLIDVSQAALALWNLSFGESLRVYFADALRLTPTDAAQLLAFWIGLHDIGKACPAFQAKHKPAIVGLREAGLEIDRRVMTNIPHGWVTYDALGHLQHGLLHQETPLERRWAQQIARAVGGHHGSWPHPTEVQQVRLRARGGDAWHQARHRLLRELASTLAPLAFGNPDFLSNPEAANAFLVMLSGFTSVADWIGSMEEYFPFRSDLMPSVDYAAISARQAEEALRQTGWLQWQSTGDLLTFENMFPEFIEGPNDIQQTIIAQTEGMIPPLLAIIEAPTGTGKTEAAFYLADVLNQIGRRQGMYIAMPTQATSNQMYDRTASFLRSCYPQSAIGPRLLHSQARWRVSPPQEVPSNITGTDSKDETAHVYGWFMPKKRGLLAPFAVGTVDQALLSVLLTRHFFVRLFGLGHKIVIFDEVHAYDTYMNTLFTRLLEWLRVVDASAIILSATLPEDTRRQLVEAYTGMESENTTLTPAAYPRLTLAAHDGVSVRPLSASDVDQRIIDIEWLPADEDNVNIVEAVRHACEAGGCVAVICHTVKRSQQVYRALKTARFVDEDGLLLFHARYPPTWRQGIEARVLGLFGKEGKRPHRMVLVATQVVEQSLDLDFDLMITDLPPVDLLIQRVGRLHRHDHQRHHGRQRPVYLAHPRVLINQPEVDADGMPAFGRGSDHIYGRFLLLASWLALQGRDHLTVPDDTTDLIELVYGDGWQSLPLGDELQRAYEDMQAKQEAAVIEAGIRDILAPGERGLLTQRNPALTEDDPNTHQRFRALTRLIDPGVSVICLHETLNGPALEPHSSRLLDLGQPLSYTDVQAILQCVVEIRDRRILYHLLEEEAHQLPYAWRDERALKYHCMAVFRDGVCRVEGTRFVLKLSREFGLEIEEEA